MLLNLQNNFFDTVKDESEIEGGTTPIIELQ
jgi:hypothetical protein